MCRLVPIIKLPPLTPQKFAYKYWKWKKIILRACLRIYRLIKQTNRSHVKKSQSNTWFRVTLKITNKHSQTEIGLVFQCRMWVLPFLLVATFTPLLFLFVLLYLHMHIRTWRVSSSFLPCWSSISGKTTAWLLNGLLIPEDQTKKLRDAITA